MNDRALHCPECLYVMRRMTNVMGEHRQPIPGTLAVCRRCLVPLIFTETLELRPLTDKEFDQLPDYARQMLFEVVMVVGGLNLVKPLKGEMIQ